MAEQQKRHPRPDMIRAWDEAHKATQVLRFVYEAASSNDGIPEDAVEGMAYVLWDVAEAFARFLDVTHDVCGMKASDQQPEAAATA